ncbi:hypothetical protein Tco_0190631 [Tanacetum coccineum]
MVAKITKKTPQDSASKQPEPATKRAPPKKPTTTTPVKPTKPPSSKQPKSPTKKPSKRKLPQKVRKGKPSFQLVDEDDKAQQESVPQGEGDDPALELAKKMSLDAHQEKGEGEGADADIERAIKLSLDPPFCHMVMAPYGREQTEAAAPKGDKEQGEVASSIVTSGVGISVRTEDQAGSDPRKEHKALAGPDPKPILPKVNSSAIAHVIDFSSPKSSSQVTTPTLPEITPFIALQLRVAKLEQDMSEVKKTDHSTAILASIKSQVPTVVDKYLGTKLDDALLRILERHTADLIKKYSVLPGPESIKI